MRSGFDFCGDKIIKDDSHLLLDNRIIEIIIILSKNMSHGQSNRSGAVIDGKHFDSGPEV